MTLRVPHRAEQEQADERKQLATPQLKRLAIVDQLLAVWIILAMAIGLIIGNFSSAAEVLEQVKFVDVSLPLGTFELSRRSKVALELTKYGSFVRFVNSYSDRTHRHDGSNSRTSISGSSRRSLQAERLVETHPLFVRRELDHSSLVHVVSRLGFPSRQALATLALSCLQTRADEVRISLTEELREGLILVGIARCIAMVGISIVRSLHSH